MSAESEGGEAIVSLEEGWDRLKKGAIAVIERYLDEAVAQVQEDEKPTAAPDAIGNDGTMKGAIFGKQAYSQMYTTVYNMCTQRNPHNWSADLYKRYARTMETYLMEKVLPAVRRQPDDVHLLKEMGRRWENHKLYARWMERFFSYLDRYYVKLQTAEPLKQKGTSLFMTHVFEHVKFDIKRAVANLIRKERDGHQIDHELIQKSTAMLMDLGGDTVVVYQRDLEVDILAETKEYYDSLSARWVEELSFPEYMIKVEEAQDNEEQRCTNYLQPTTNTRMKCVLVERLLDNRMDALMSKDTGLEFLLRNHHREDMTRMYQLISQVDGGLLPLAVIFRQHVQEAGVNTISDKLHEVFESLKSKDGNKTRTMQDPGMMDRIAKTVAADSSFIQSIMDLHDYYKKIARDCFGGCFVFQKAFKEAFETFVNRDIGRQSVAVLLVYYCDRLLKKSGKIAEENVETMLSRAVEMFTFIADKDHFIEFYRSLLSRRLLNELSASEDAEKSMIQKFKMKCGAAFTSKIEGMLNDLITAKETQNRFTEHCTKLVKASFSTTDGAIPSVQAHLFHDVEFQPTILTTGHWPSYPTSDLRLPPEFSKCAKVFTDFYHEVTSHRRLSWIHSLGSVTLQRVFVKRHDLICTTYQACILLMFNKTRESIAVAQIADELKLDENQTKRLIASMYLGSFKILERIRRSPTSGDSQKGQILTSDAFEINESFTDPHRKLKLPSPVQDEPTGREKVEVDRSHAIEAAIVRVMKARKRLDHSQLVFEVMSLLQFFKPSPKAIKQRIEGLIERDYVERDADDPSVFIYVA